MIARNRPGRGARPNVDTLRHGVHHARHRREAGARQAIHVCHCPHRPDASPLRDRPEIAPSPNPDVRHAGPSTYPAKSPAGPSSSNSARKSIRSTLPWTAAFGPWLNDASPAPRSTGAPPAQATILARPPNADHQIAKRQHLVGRVHRQRRLDPRRRADRIAVRHRAIFDHHGLRACRGGDHAAVHDATS